MQQLSEIYGVDVSKATLMTARHGNPSSVRSIINATAAIQVWLDSLPPGCTVAMEATGKYHRELAQLAHASGRRVFVLNARDVHFYAKALSGRGKTDRLDAQVIARFAAEHQGQLHVWCPAAALPRQLQSLLQRRARVVGSSVSLKQALKDVPELHEASDKLQAAFFGFLAEVDRQIQALLQQDETLRARTEKLDSITGFGPQGSTILGALFSSIEFDNADAVVAYSGMDPRPQDSGTKRGKRRLSKRGPAWLRRQMYLAAFAASHSKALGPLYRQIKARGFAPTQALNILARKLLRVAWAIWKSDKPFDPSKLAPG